MTRSACCLVLMALIQFGSAADAETTVVLVQGSVTSGTDESVQPLNSLDRIAPGATINTGEGSAALLSLPSGAFVYLGELTQVRLPAEDENADLHLDTGEIRITGKDAIVSTPLAKALVVDGTMRVRVDGDTVTFFAEVGEVGIRGENGDRLILPEGSQVTYSREKGFQPVQPADLDDWQLDPDAVALSAANAMNRPRDLPPSRSATPNPSASESDSGVPGDNTNIQNSGLSGVNLSLGTTLVSSAAGSAGGAFTDANQDTLSGSLTTDFGPLMAGSAFPGTIHLITGQTAYRFDDVAVTAADNFPGTTQYWSIGAGPSPTGQVVTNFLTGTGAAPDVIRIPQFDNYIVHLEQFNAIDSADPTTVQAVGVGISGLIGENPISPDIRGATPLEDERAALNSKATFALGEFSVSLDGGRPVISMRRSDQDRTIVKNDNGNDDLDEVTANPDVTTFVQAPDPRFLPQNPTVFVPGSGPDAIQRLPRYSSSLIERKAAFTVLTARQLAGYAGRTGQTRFVVDGQIVDISGFQP